MPKVVGLCSDSGIIEKATGKPLILPMLDFKQAQQAGRMLCDLLDDSAIGHARFTVTITSLDQDAYYRMLGYLGSSLNQNLRYLMERREIQDKQGIRFVTELKISNLTPEEVDFVIDPAVNQMPIYGVGWTIEVAGYMPEGVLTATVYPLTTIEQRKVLYRQRDGPAMSLEGSTGPCEMAILFLPQIVKTSFGRMHIAESPDPKSEAFARVEALLSGSDGNVLKRLATVKRYSHSRPLIKQSTSEHSYGVAYLAWDLSNLFNQIGVRNSRERVMGIAVHHDCDEANRIGDVPFDRKYLMGKRSEKLRRRLEPVVRATVGRIAKTHSDTEAAYQKMLLMKEERDRNSIEAKIVKLADILECAPYLEREIAARKRLPANDPRRKRTPKFEHMLSFNRRRARDLCDSIITEALTLKERVDEVEAIRRQGPVAVASEVRSLYLDRAGSTSRVP